MTQISLPWQGTTTGDAGPFSDSNWRDGWAALLHAWAAGSAYANRGPLIDSGSAPNVGLQVQATSPASAAVDVLVGAAVVEGGLYRSDATETIAVAANASGNPRIDTIVLRKDDASQTIRLAIKQGTPAATPAPPALTQTAGVMWEIPLADIAVANGFASITADDITPRAEWANAADGIYIKDVLNNSGVTLETGDPVIWDTSADRAVTTTTQEYHPLVAGVWVGRTQNGDYGRVLSRGIGFVTVDGAYSRGDGLYTSSTAAQAQAAPGRLGNIGILLSDTSGAGERALAYVDVKPLPQSAQYSYTVAQGTTGSAFTAGADRTVPVNTEDSDPWGIGAVAANQVTLQPGRYRFTAKMTIGNPSSGTEISRMKLYDTTGAALLDISVNITTSSGGEDVLGAMDGEFAIGVASALELRIRCSGNLTAPQALNVAGETETYVKIRFERML